MRRAPLELETLFAAGLSAAIPLCGFVFDAVSCLSGPMAEERAR
jgi:hypothetical protein